MRVLLIVHDLYANFGGGQTFYRKLIEDHPEDDFWYFRSNEAVDISRPPNAHAIPFRTNTRIRIVWPSFFPQHHADALLEAAAHVDSLEGQNFDIVDCPDFVTFGAYLPLAFARTGDRPGAFVLSMHGNISDSLSYTWNGRNDRVEEQRDLERTQFEVFDHRYAISQTYADEWRARCERDIDILDPLSVLSPPPLAAAVDQDGKPRLLCIGRREPRKGNDLAIELAAWINPNLHSGLEHIGDEDEAKSEAGSDAILSNMSRSRNLDWRTQPSKPHTALASLYASNVALLCPVRYDTFNLVALEALAMGCPVAISSRAGVAGWLQARGNNKAFLVLDIDDLPGAVAQLESWLAAMPEARAAARKYAHELRAEIRPLRLRETYATALDNAKRSKPPRLPPVRWTCTGNDAAQTDPAHAPAAASSLPPVGAASRLITGVGSTVRTWTRTGPLAQYLSPAVHRLRDAARPAAHVAASIVRPNLQILSTEIAAMRERSLLQISDKIEALTQRSATLGAFRCDVWAELARLERLRGREEVAAAYDIRVLRLTGQDPYNRLAQVTAHLQSNAMAPIAEILNHQYASTASLGRLEAALDHRRTALRASPGFGVKSVERDVDRREKTTSPKVSIIVSLYKAAHRMPAFLARLQAQTLARHGQVELIFVDANSPLDEFTPIETHAGVFAGAFVYVRAKTRETIQTAWNHGLERARGDYIACLGVDESLYPEALEKLATKLDSDPAIDWVMANSLVCEVDQHGTLVRDKMVYDRSDATKEMAYLDTTFVSWVGGLYRRDLHQRFGYYDGAFRAAGDTEFKMRVLRDARVEFLPETLGIFLDYPDDRATLSARAEIEDALAWHAHRTPAGIGLLFDKRKIEAAAQLLEKCAGYRKAFGSLPSSDVEMGACLAGWLQTRGVAGAAEQAATYEKMLSDLRTLDLSASVRSDSRRAIAHTLSSWRKHTEGLTESNDFRVHNDNRFEQHSVFWP